MIDETGTSAQEIVDRVIARLRVLGYVVEEVSTGLFNVRVDGSDTAVHLATDTVAAELNMLLGKDAESLQVYFVEQQIDDDGRTLSEVISDEIASNFDLTVVETSNRHRVWTYFEGAFEPVEPEEVLEYLNGPPLAALTLSGNGLIGMTSSGLREVPADELNLDSDLVRRLTSWLSQVANLTNVEDSDKEPGWRNLNPQGAALARELREALGSSVIVGYADRSPFSEPAPSDSPDDSPTIESGGFWTTDSGKGAS